MGRTRREWCALSKKGFVVQAFFEGAAGRSPRFYAGLSVAAAVVTIALKAGAYLLTGSVGLFSDAVESVVNLVAALGAFWALTVAARPPDEEHAFGHTVYTLWAILTTRREISC